MNGAVADGSARQETVSEGDGINEWFECRTNLPVCRRERAIELALRVIAPTDQRANSAARVIDHHNRAFQIWHGRIPFSALGRLIACFERMMEIGLMLDLGELRLERLLRGVLHGWIQRGVD